MKTTTNSIGLQKALAAIPIPKSSEPFFIKRNGRRVGAVISYRLFKRMIEALEDAEDIKAAEEVRKAIAKGQKTHSWEDVKRELGMT